MHSQDNPLNEMRTKREHGCSESALNKFIIHWDRIVYGHHMPHAPGQHMHTFLETLSADEERLKFSMREPSVGYMR